MPKGVNQGILVGNLGRDSLPAKNVHGTNVSSIRWLEFICGGSSGLPKLRFPAEITY
jgi:hypothetical protein